MAKQNKVEFGLSQVHMGTYDYDPETKKVTLGTPVAIPGAVTMSYEVKSDSEPFYADNVQYYNAYGAEERSGEMEMALIPDNIRTEFLGYKKTKDGGLGRPTGAINKTVYIAFQAEGDAASSRVVFYNVSLGAISREYATKEDKTKPVTEKLPFTVTGDVPTGIGQLVYRPDETGYNTVFTAPTAPAIEDKVL